MFFTFIAAPCFHLALSTPIQYKFLTDKIFNISTTLTYSGDIPMFGGQKGEATAKLSFRLQAGNGTEPSGMATESLTAFAVTFNKMDLPVTLKDALKYFPTSQYKFDTVGTFQGLLPPAKPAPVRLPGLTIENVPRVSFLPLKLASGLEAGNGKIEVSDTLVGGTQKYLMWVTNASATEANLEFSFQATTEGYEDAAQMVVHDKADAESRVLVTESGLGKAIFSFDLGAMTTFRLSGDATYKVYNLSSHKVTYRHLKRKVEINLAPIAANSEGK